MVAQDYFLESAGSPAQIEIQLNKLEDIFTAYDCDDLAAFRTKLESNTDLGKEMLSTLFDEEVILDEILIVAFDGFRTKKYIQSNS